MRNHITALCSTILIRHFRVVRHFRHFFTPITLFGSRRTMSINIVPSLPSPSLNDIGRTLQVKMHVDLTTMEQDIQNEEGQRDAFFKLVSHVQYFTQLLCYSFDTI